MSIFRERCKASTNGKGTFSRISKKEQIYSETLFRKIRKFKLEFSCFVTIRAEFKCTAWIIKIW